MVGSRQAVEGDHGPAIHTGGDKTTSFALSCCKSYQRANADDAQQRADTVGKTVEQFLNLLVVNHSLMKI